MMEDEMGQDRTLDADAAMTAAFDTAERVAMLLDRHYGDAGDDAEMIERWDYTLCQLEAEILRTLGAPRTRLPGGGLVPRNKGDK
jgi:hypothetical protein